MPRALGHDRLDVAASGRLVLTCADSKGWRARRPATATSPEHPGSAVRWEGQFYEVLEILPEGSGVQYVLELWDPRHTMRVVETYSEETEAIRSVESGDAARRADRHVFLHLVAPLAGSLPGHVQEELEAEYNVPAVRLSLASAIPLWVLGWLALILLLASSIAGAGSVPAPVLLLGVYFLAESTARLAVCLLQGRPIGTLAGTMLYGAWTAIGRKRPAAADARTAPAGAAGPEADAAAVRDVLDRYHLLEPAAGLLSAVDQARLAERFGFDAIRWGRVSAVFLLVMFGPLAAASTLGTLVVFEPADLPKIAVFGGIVVEQAVRLRRLQSGRVAPSLFGILVRPFAGPLLA